MATSYRAFQIEMYEEYLSNCAFLSDQRREMLAQPCGKWGALREWEERIEAQIDGLVVGGDLALQVCKRRAVAGEPGEFETALRVFIRQSRPDLIEKVVEKAQASEGPKAEAIAEGLLHERHPGLADVVRRIFEMNSEFLPVLARVIGFQRLPLGDLLLDWSSMHPSMVWALGRLREQRATGRLYDLLSTAPEDHKVEVALALLRITNHPRASERWPLFTLGLLGKSESRGYLLSDTSGDSSLSLGLLGDTYAIPSLISRLPQPEAALALQLITGAGLTTQTPVEDEDLEPGERPTLETKIETRQEVWSVWWQDHEMNLPPGCLSCGVPNTPDSLWAHLGDPERTHADRHWIVEQLAIRHGQGVGVEADMHFRDQCALFPHLPT